MAASTTGDCRRAYDGVRSLPFNVNDYDRINEGPGEHDAHLMDDDQTETVVCPRCGKHVWAYSQRCHHCGVHFRGEAWQFDGADVRAHRTGRRWLIVIILVVLALLLFTVFWQ